MTELVESSPDDLLDSLAFGLLKQRKALQQLGRRPSHEPGNDDCHAIARELVEHLKRTGVVKIIRQHAVAHSMLKGS